MAGQASEHHPLILAVKPLADAAGIEIVDSSEMGDLDLPLIWDGVVVAACRMPDMHGALDRMIASVERHMGAPLHALSKEGKQEAVRVLDQRGAFVMRRGVEKVAAVLGVSRFTVYNYLNAQDPSLVLLEDTS